MGEQTLKNIARPGARLSCSARAAGHGASRDAHVRRLALPDKPSIAVLPFQNMSGDPEQEYFADGMVEDIITALSRIRWLFVIARNSSFTYKGQAVDMKQVGRELGVRYVLEGACAKCGKRVRITAQLIEPRPARICGPTGSTARSKTSSSCRTRSPSASPASSSRRLQAAEITAVDGTPDQRSVGL